MNSSQIFLPDGWRSARLGEVCGATETRDPRREPDNIFKYVDITSVDNNIKRITEAREIIGKEAPSRARQVIHSDDVIVSTTRPNLNAVALVPRELDNQICSTGFCVLRPTQAIDSSFLFSFVQTQKFIGELSESVKGALYPAVTDQQVRAVEIPLPPLPEQRRIAARLNEIMAEVARAREAAQDALDAANAIPNALLRAVFESEDVQSSPVKNLEQVCEITARQVDPKLPEYASMPHISGENIESGTLRLKYLNTAEQDQMTSGKYLFDAGDVLYNKLRPYLRKATVVDFAGVCSADMYPIQVNREMLECKYLAWLLVTDDFTKYADEQSRRARMPKLNREQLFAYQTPIPTLEVQKQIVARLDSQNKDTEKTRAAAQAQLDALNALPAAYLKKAFRGEL